MPAARLQWRLPLQGIPVAKPNYSFEKKQRELAKKKQQDEKDARKREAREAAKAKAESSNPASSGETPRAG
jgi:sRNA-binding protein